MLVFDAWGVTGIGKDIVLQGFWQVAIDDVQIGKPAAEDDDIGIKDVDDASEGSGQSIRVSSQDGNGNGIPGSRIGGDFAG